MYILEWIGFGFFFEFPTVHLVDICPSIPYANASYKNVGLYETFGTLFYRKK